MPKLLIALLLSCAALAANTTVTQAVVGPDGNPANGKAVITLSSTCATGGSYAGTAAVTVPFIAGNFSVSLTPNDSCTPHGTYYNVAWTICQARPGASAMNPCPGNGTNWTERWAVATSSTPVSVASVIIPNIPTSLYVTQVRNESPVFAGAGYCSSFSSACTTWTLKHAPSITGATCWLGGTYQTPGWDYVLVGSILMGFQWVQSDYVHCDYQY